MSAPWGTDTIVSMPAPLRREQRVLADMGAFAFTEFGIGHNFNRSDLEVFLSPTFRPLITPEVS